MSEKSFSDTDAETSLSASRSQSKNDAKAATNSRNVQSGEVRGVSSQAGKLPISCSTQISRQNGAPLHDHIVLKQHSANAPQHQQQQQQQQPRLFQYPDPPGHPQSHQRPIWHPISYYPANSEPSLPSTPAMSIAIPSPARYSTNPPHNFHLRRKRNNVGVQNSGVNDNTDQYLPSAPVTMTPPTPRTPVNNLTPQPSHNFASLMTTPQRTLQRTPQRTPQRSPRKTAGKTPQKAPPGVNLQTPTKPIYATPVKSRHAFEQSPHQYHTPILKTKMTRPYSDIASASKHDKKKRKTPASFVGDYNPDTAANRLSPTNAKTREYLEESKKPAPADDARSKRNPKFGTSEMPDEGSRYVNWTKEGTLHIANTTKDADVTGTLSDKVPIRDGKLSQYDLQKGCISEENIHVVNNSHLRQVTYLNFPLPFKMTSLERSSRVVMF